MLKVWTLNFEFWIKIHDSRFEIRRAAPCRAVPCRVVRSFVRSFVRTRVQKLDAAVRSKVRSFQSSFLPKFVRSKVRSFQSSFLPKFVRSKVRSFHSSFARSFVRSFVLRLLVCLRTCVLLRRKSVRQRNEDIRVADCLLVCLFCSCCCRSCG